MPWFNKICVNKLTGTFNTWCERLPLPCSAVVIQVSTPPVACHINSTCCIMNNCHSVAIGEHVLTVPYPESGIYQRGTLSIMNWYCLQMCTMVAMAPIQSLDGRSVVNQRSSTDCCALVRMAIHTCRSNTPWQPYIGPLYPVQSGGRRCDFFQLGRDP